MILDQIAWIDIFVFLAFLVPRLLIDVGLLGTLGCGIKALPFLGSSIACEMMKRMSATDDHHSNYNAHTVDL
jgi:hypothetical protein